MPEERTATTNLYLIFTLACLALINMQDGFDILAISYASSAIKSDWNMQDGEFGVVLSAGLLGMALGAVFLASLADKFGRKIIAISGLFLSGVGMLIVMMSINIEMLIAGRILTGFGVGGILASMNTLVAEYAGKRFRVTAIAVFQLGFPIGAFLAGYIVAWLLGWGEGGDNWRPVFAFGAFTSFIFIPVMLMLPESTAYLANKGGPDSLEKINKIQRQFGRAELVKLPAVDHSQKLSLIDGVKGVLGPNYIVRTLLIWLSFFLLLTTLYFLLSQVPNIVQAMRFTEADGNLAGRLINICGVIGVLCLVIFGRFANPSLITGSYMILLSGLLIYFSRLSSPSLSTVLLIVSVFGILVHGSMVGLYSTVANLYPARLRATGTGFAIGISRYGAVIGPALAGQLLEAKWTPFEIFALFAVPTTFAALTILSLWAYQTFKMTPVTD